jgi:hypothetical protein
MIRCQPSKIRDQIARFFALGVAKRAFPHHLAKHYSYWFTCGESLAERTRGPGDFPQKAS